MPIAAVIFDLFGTLVENSAVTEHKAVLAEMLDLVRCQHP
jgi:FMN phosphatase YigB (HAD superfamily)